MGLTADQATRMTPLLLAGVILTAGFALVAHLAPGRAVRAPDVQPIDPSNNEKGVDIDASWPEADWLALSDSLRALNHNVPPDEDDEGEEGETGNGGETGELTEDGRPPEIARGNFKFLGAIVQGDSAAALVEVNGRQRFVRIDDEIANHTIKSIHDDYIVVIFNGEEGRISLADPGRSRLNSAERFQRDTQRAAEAQRNRVSPDRRIPPDTVTPDRDR